MHQQLRHFEFEYPEIILGSSLAALICSYERCIPFLSVKLKKPSRFTYFETDQDLSIFGVKNQIRTLKSINNQTKDIGIEQSLLWDKLFFFLSLAGLNVMSNRTSSIHIEDNLIKAFTPNARMGKFRFGKLIVFDDELVDGLPEVKEQPEPYFEIRDYINVNNGMNIPFDYIDTEDDFGKNIIFYPSDRICGDHENLKDILSISYGNLKQLDEYDWSDTNIRFKILYLMKQAGLKGAKNGNGQTRSLKTETIKRELIQIAENKYSDTENIKFDRRALDEILSSLVVEDSKVTKLMSKFKDA